MRHALLFPALCVLVSCGGDSRTPTSPEPSDGGPAYLETAGEWTLAGRVTTTLSRAPVAGARVSAGDIQAVTDSSGRFELRSDSTLAGPLAVKVQKGGYVTRYTHVAHPRDRALEIGAIASGRPFSLGFYRALLRNYQESGYLYPNLRWTRRPTFYLRTRDQTGRAVDPDVLRLVRRELVSAFSAWTGGRYKARVQQGAADRPDAPGVVRILFIRGRRSPICGRATVGGDSGWMELYLSNCNCGSRKITAATVWHEAGHTAGFFHVRGRYMMNPYLNNLCDRRVDISSAERHHSRIAYDRPHGNTDPDRDPPDFALEQPVAGDGPIVSCPRP